MLNRAASDAERRARMARLDALLDEAVTAGVLIESRLAQRIGCREEELPTCLTVPAIRNALRSRDLRYIEGFGLCTAAMLVRVRDATADVTDLRDNPSGNHQELWYHGGGCRSWLVVTRNTRTHEISDVKFAGGEK